MHHMKLKGLRVLTKNTWSLDMGRCEVLLRHVLIGEELCHIAEILVNLLLHLLSGLPYLKPIRYKLDESESLSSRLFAFRDLGLGWAQNRARHSIPAISNLLTQGSAAAMSFSISLEVFS